MSQQPEKDRTEPQLLLREEANGVVTLTLNRADKSNALCRQLLLDLHRECEELQFRSDVRVVILTGAGTKAFCAGADLRERKGMDEAQVRRAVHLIRLVVTDIAALPMPVIAAINGVAFGGGTELALSCDIRVAAENAQMGLTETSLAIVPGAGGTQRLPRLIGVAHAKELIFTARRISATEAHAYGLVNHVVAAGQAQAKAQEIAYEIARNGPLAVVQSKFAIDNGLNVDLNTGLAIEKKAYEMILPTADRLEGLLAFAEKRKPNYQGK